jgi:hypothetical protein
MCSLSAQGDILFRKRILKHLLVSYVRNIFNMIPDLLLYNI